MLSRTLRATSVLLAAVSIVACGGGQTSDENGDTVNTHGSDAGDNHDAANPNFDSKFVIGIDGISGFDSLSADQKNALRESRVFFEHMSVGDDIVRGHNNWSPPWQSGTNFLGFEFRTVGGAADYATSTLGDSTFGFNGNPFDKISAFSNSVRVEIGSVVQIAGFKFCYNDITTTATPNISDVINAYRAAFESIEAALPNSVFFHVTTPLQPAEEWHTVENNTLRASFADFLRGNYAGGKHVVFDLQAIESTKANGDNCTQSGVPVLCSEWAADRDGHLSGAGSTRAAKAFLYSLHVARGLL